jgi:hypothetical protein
VFAAIIAGVFVPDGMQHAVHHHASEFLAHRHPEPLRLLRHDIRCDVDIADERSRWRRPA